MYETVCLDSPNVFYKFTVKKKINFSQVQKSIQVP